MISRLIVRTVLVAILVLISWLVGLTWFAQGANTAQKVLLFIIEGGVFLAAASLLIESFLSFGNRVMARSGYKYVLSGLLFLDVKGDEEQINVRTCALFASRSFLFVVSGLMIAMIIVMLFILGKNLILFLLNPYVPTVHWGWIFRIVLFFVVMVSTSLLFARWLEQLQRKTSHWNIVVRIVTLGSCGALLTGMLLGVTFVFFASDAPFAGMPYYLIILHSVYMVLGIAIGFGVAFSLGYGLYILAGKGILLLSQRFPVLNDVWNQFCPLRTVRFK